MNALARVLETAITQLRDDEETKKLARAKNYKNYQATRQREPTKLKQRRDHIEQIIVGCENDEKERILRDKETKKAAEEAAKKREVEIEIKARVILDPKNILTPFDLRTQTFRVNAELSTYYGEYTRKNFESKGYFRTFFQILKIEVKRFFWTIGDRQHTQTFFSSQWVTLGHFFRILWPKWVTKISFLTKIHHKHICKIELVVSGIEAYPRCCFLKLYMMI